MASARQKKIAKLIDAAMLQRIERALADPENCGLSAHEMKVFIDHYGSIAAAKPTSTRSRIIQNLKLAGGGKLPPISDEPDAAVA